MSSGIDDVVESGSDGPPPRHPHPGPPGSRRQNLILAALPVEEAELVAAQGRRVELKVRRQVAERHQPVKYVYFPLAGIISLVVVMFDGSTVEMATIGNEGIVGFPMGIRASAGADAMVQVDGEALRIPADRFLLLLNQTSQLPLLLQRFEGALLQQVGQNAGCNRLHSTDQRLSRWLLMVQDRVGASEYRLTHEFLAIMLGVRRASVSEAAEKFQDLGAISYKHGHITVLDRQMLENVACECYASIRDVFDGLYA